MKNIPKTPFATQLSGSAKETQLRLRSIFQWKKHRPPVWLFALTAIVLIGCFGLVSCRPEPDPNAITLHTADGRELTVELELEPTLWDENYYEVLQLRVKEEEKLLQVIEPEELTKTYDIDGLYLLRGYAVGEPDVRDFDFDGDEDLALLAQSALPKDPPYLFFLWKEDEQRLQDAFVMTAFPEIDMEQQQIVEKMADGRRDYYVYQDGVLHRQPAAVQPMEELSQIGKPFAQFSDMEYRSVPIPDACGWCMGNEGEDTLYFFFGSQDILELPGLPAACSQKLRCAGIVTTVGQMYPEITESMNLTAFCAALGLAEHTYGYEDLPDQGWLNFSWEGYTVWIDTANSVTEVHHPSEVVIRPDDTILVLNEEIERENLEIGDKFRRGEPLEDTSGINASPAVSEARPLSELSATQRNWLADLPVEELPREAAQLGELVLADMWRDLLIPLASDEQGTVTVYGVVDLKDRRTEDGIPLEAEDVEPYGIVIRNESKAAYYSLDWSAHLYSAENPELYVEDFDGDGAEEAAVVFRTGQETDFSAYQTLIFELDTLALATAG